VSEFIAEKFEWFQADAPDLKPVMKENLHEKIYAVLKRNLMMGRFGPNQKLPLRGLAASLGTSLMPVRDALQRLESLGCVVSTANRTMMVPNFSRKEWEDMRMLRVLLEGRAAEAAAVNRTNEHLDALSQYCADTERSVDTYNLDLFLEANYNFHMAIADASGISFVADLLEPLWLRLGPLVRRSTPDQANMRKAVKFHRQARNAIAVGDSAAARRAVRADIIEGNQS
jgi:GntR family colanic acid and biofilm gene transcriptional regulator